MVEQKDNVQNQEPEIVYTPEDIEANKVVAGLSYLLFFLPLIVCPQSRYARFHANQALVLLIAGIAGHVVLGMIPVIGWLMLPFFGLGVLLLGIIGLINGFGGKDRRLPLIGQFTILK